MAICALILLHILTFTSGQEVYQCDQRNEYAVYVSCLNKWRIVREHSLGHSTFLKDVRLIDEICILPEGATVQDMDMCVTETVSPYCDAILAHWQGLEAFVSFLCKHREAFEGYYARCRKSVSFQSAYEDCMSTNVQQINAGTENCRSYIQLKRCLKTALVNFCSGRATEFFSLAFTARDAPLLAYSCKQDANSVIDYSYSIQSDEPQTGGHDTTNKHGIHVKTTFEENLEVAVANNCRTMFSGELVFIPVLLIIRRVLI